MTTDRASAIQREVEQLVDLQITTMSQESSLSSAQLLDYNSRFERIQVLYKELDQIKRAEIVIKFATVS